MNVTFKWFFWALWLYLSIFAIILYLYSGFWRKLVLRNVRRIFGLVVNIVEWQYSKTLQNSTCQRNCTWRLEELYCCCVSGIKWKSALKSWCMFILWCHGQSIWNVIAFCGFLRTRLRPMRISAWLSIDPYWQLTIDYMIEYFLHSGDFSSFFF